MNIAAIVTSYVESIGCRLWCDEPALILVSHAMIWCHVCWCFEAGGDFVLVNREGVECVPSDVSMIKESMTETMRSNLRYIVRGRQIVAGCFSFGLQLT
jgi:hypothetical protein